MVAHMYLSYASLYFFSPGTETNKGSSRDEVGGFSTLLFLGISEMRAELRNAAGIPECPALLTLIECTRSGIPGIVLVQQMYRCRYLSIISHYSRWTLSHKHGGAQKVFPTRLFQNQMDTSRLPYARSIKRYCQASKHIFWCMESLVMTLCSVHATVEAFPMYRSTHGSLSSLVMSRHAIDSMFSLLPSLRYTAFNCR
jgi:hypothetical protein